MAATKPSKSTSTTAKKQAPKKPAATPAAAGEATHLERNGDRSILTGWDHACFYHAVDTVTGAIIESFFMPTPLRGLCDHLLETLKFEADLIVSEDDIPEYKTAAHVLYVGDLDTKQNVTPGTITVITPDSVPQASKTLVRRAFLDSANEYLFIGTEIPLDKYRNKSASKAKASDTAPAGDDDAPKAAPKRSAAPKKAAPASPDAAEAPAPAPKKAPARKAPTTKAPAAAKRPPAKSGATAAKKAPTASSTAKRPPRKSAASA